VTDAPPPAIAASGLGKIYDLPRRRLFGRRPVLQALDDIDLSIAPGARFGIVGESGSGKSTLARLVVGLERPSAGSLAVLGHRMAGDPRLLEGAAQMVFQDPYGSLDPRRRIGAIVAEPLWRLRDRAQRHAEAQASLAAVGLGTSESERYPHELSGGQRQRVAIARALVTRPQILVADEPVSALDVSIRAQILNLLRELGSVLPLTQIVISHDLAVIRYLCDELVVIYRGRIVEEGGTALLDAPLHPYTQALREAVPHLIPGRRRHRAARPVAEIAESPSSTGCAYRGRCPRALPRCITERPLLAEHRPGQRAACHNPLG
jgi:peptide/nickel transport system ATP-binding protein